MKTTKTETVLAYLTARPASMFRQIVNATCMSDMSVNTSLCQLVQAGKVIRNGEKGNYEYSVAPGHEVRGWQPPARTEPFEPGFGCANPLTRLFNECLAGVRA